MRVSTSRAANFEMFRLSESRIKQLTIHQCKVSSLHRAVVVYTTCLNLCFFLFAKSDVNVVMFVVCDYCYTKTKREGQSNSNRVDYIRDRVGEGKTDFHT